MCMCEAGGGGRRARSCVAWYCVIVLGNVPCGGETLGDRFCVFVCVWGGGVCGILLYTLPRGSQPVRHASLDLCMRVCIEMREDQ